jgi:hypothetical protein
VVAHLLLLLRATMIFSLSISLSRGWELSLSLSLSLSLWISPSRGYRRVRGKKKQLRGSGLGLAAFALTVAGEHVGHGPSLSISLDFAIARLQKSGRGKETAKGERPRAGGACPHRRR